MTPIAIAVVEHEGQFLIGRRSAAQTLAGMWEFPGGRVEAGESPRDAAVRECLEETGLTIEVIEEYATRVQRYDHDEVALRFFACRLLGSHTEPLAPFRWVPRASLGDYQFPDGNRDLLKLLA